MANPQDSGPPPAKARSPDKPAGPRKRPRGLRKAPPVGPAPSYETIRIDSHRGLLAKQREIFERLDDSPEIASLLLLNPVLALKEVGVELTPELRKHVLHAIQHPPGPRARREELEAGLRERLGEVPKPLDRQWVATVLFDALKLTPLRTRGHRPSYLPALSDESVERMKKLRPSIPEASYVPRSGRGTVIRVKEWRPAFRRMDLDAELSELAPATEAPKTVSLETLYFYKDSHPVARDLLELGLLHKRAFPVQSSASYRKIREGEKANAFRSWIKGVRFGRSMRGDDA